MEWAGSSDCTESLKKLIHVPEVLNSELSEK